MQRQYKVIIFLSALAIAAAALALWRARPSGELRFADTPFTLGGPLRSYWEANNGAAALGPPRSAPLWRDGQLVQHFERAALRVGDWGSIERLTLPANWRDTLPPEALALQASPYRAGLRAELRGPSTAAPLAPLTMTLEVPGYSGPLELRLYDARMQPAGTWWGEVRAGAGALVVLPGGALGVQQGLALIDGRIAGISSALYTLDAQTDLRSGLARFDALFTLARSFLARSALEYELDGQAVHGYRSPDSNLLWLRDHTYQARAARYFDRELRSLVDAFRRAQQPNGSFPDFLAWPEKQLPARRMTVEADVEFLFVQAVYEAWQASGDDDWLRVNLPAMRRALHYTLNDPQRWDAGRGLVKRPYTIDTWDFEYGPSTVSPDDGRPAPRHWIDARTRWSIFHGDNTGLARSLRLLARIEERVGGGAEIAERLREQARGIMQRLNELSWNGNFFTHQVALEAWDVPGVDEAQQLSLSNALALNRGVLEAHQERAIVEEYYRRYAQRGERFAEWYGIDPPFPPGAFGLGGRKGELPGEYVNGGIMPLVGGELARGAFASGAEPYAFDILARYTSLITATNSSYLWYYPAGNPGISGVDTSPHDGWGASAMLAALIEGAAGIADNTTRLNDVTLSPRWVAAPDAAGVAVTARYPASDGYIAYRWQLLPSGIILHCTGSGERLRLQLLLPQKARPNAVLVDGREAEFELDKSSGSLYALLEIPVTATVEVRW
jgi:hypothetical protein